MSQSAADPENTHAADEVPHLQDRTVGESSTDHAETTVLTESAGTGHDSASEESSGADAPENTPGEAASEEAELDGAASDGAAGSGDAEATAAPAAATAIGNKATAEYETAVRRLPDKLTFRITGASLIAVIIVTVCMSPLALSSWWLALLFLVPIGMAVWVLRVRTVVTPESVAACSLTRTTTVRWDDVKSLRLDERRWVRLVLASGREVTLPAVRVRNLPNLAAMSGGRIADPGTEA
ncbi:hypothetical protein GIY23_17675 [Allosaccharopolyspora coralli]|uniref:Low molecular weight protein antigen 6 PH domain-containing protein n=1 Tax=Allosaccharopolyspora coralli TaxID=2665642 RepID=A0A5Q3QD46_9PSEU|nr:PH domain-containing protein [Allosaccharopolyspora coralli]QGK71104.1 hypothetical protein GIY23_17675 [Allosaccharopolyspora coralli]